MTRDELRELIQKTIDTGGYGGWKTDIAIKIYFYPLSSALFSDEDPNFMDAGGLAVSPSRWAWVTLELAKRLQALICEMNPDEEIFLSVIVYGGCKDLCFHIDPSSPTANMAYETTIHEIIPVSKR